jgi:hypothetical protein
MHPASGFSFRLAPLVDSHAQRKIVTADLVPTFTKRKRWPATCRREQLGVYPLVRRHDVS